MQKKKKIIIAILTFILLLGGVFIAKKVMGPKVEFTEMNNGYYKEEGTDLFDVSVGTEEDSSEIVFKVNDSKLSYKLPLEPNWEKDKEGNILAQAGSETFKYSFINKKNKTVGLQGKIVLKEKPSHNVYTFPLQLENITRNRKVSSRDFYDKEDNRIIYMKEPLMIDSNGNQSKDINLRITKSQIALVPSKDWLEADNREYPVTIDMSLKVADSLLNSKK